MHKNILERTLCHYCGSELPKTGAKKDKQFGIVHEICFRILKKGREFESCIHPAFIQDVSVPEYATCPDCRLMQKITEIPEELFVRMDPQGEPGAARFHRRTHV